MKNNQRKTLFVAFVVSLGGFLFGFDAGIISGVMTYATPEFNLEELQVGWVVSSPSFSAMVAMLIAGRLSDVIGRKKILIWVAISYALSALLSAYAISYTMLYLARMLGGFAFGAALILAPIYIAEISAAKNRGRLVSIQQLNIVLGFFAAFLSNYYFNEALTNASGFLTSDNVWRWMLGVEFFPALLYLILLFFVPKSPRWLATNGRLPEAKVILNELHGPENAKIEIDAIEKSISEDRNKEKVKILALFKPALRFTLFVGLTIGILQQITGINAIYFYATSIFKQTGIGTDAAFAQGVLLSFTTVVVTLLAMNFIDRIGRRPLMNYGMGGIAISLLLCAYGFSQATYQLKPAAIAKMQTIEADLLPLADIKYTNDVAFKNAVKARLGNQRYTENEGTILEAATTINATLVLIGILGFIACFAFSLGPVMWVMLSELFPNKYRGLAIGFVGFVNSLASSLVQLIFPWELSNFGNAISFLIFGLIALIGFFVLLKVLPETKGKSLEQIEADLVG